MFKKTFLAIKNNVARLAFCLAVFYGSFLTIGLFSYQDEILPDLVESEFFIGDEDVDPSPARYLEIFRLNHSQARSGFISWTIVPSKSLPGYSLSNGTFPLLRDFLKLRASEDFTVLYSSFRI